MIQNYETAFVFGDANNGYGGFLFSDVSGCNISNLRWLAGNYPDSQSALFNQSLVVVRRLKQTLEALSCPSQVTKFKKYQYQIFSPWAEIHKSVLEKCQIETICSTDTKAIHKGESKTWFCFSFRFLCVSQEPHETLVLTPQGSSAYTLLW